MPKPASAGSTIFLTDVALVIVLAAMSGLRFCAMHDDFKEDYKRLVFQLSTRLQKTNPDKHAEMVAGGEIAPLPEKQGTKTAFENFNVFG